MAINLVRKSSYSFGYFIFEIAIRHFNGDATFNCKAYRQQSRVEITIAL